MSILDRLFNRKESAAGTLISQSVVGQAVFTPRRYDTLAKEAYQHNVIAFRCIDMIAEAVASVPWDIYNGDEPVANHQFYEVMANPNPTHGFPALLANFISYYLISGNAYMERTKAGDGRMLELYSHRPDRMKIIAGQKGRVAAYEYSVDGGTPVRWDVDALSGNGDIFHLKHFHPLNDWYGMAPLEAAAWSVDQHNAAGVHNASLLQNGANPSGMVIFKTQPKDAMLERAEAKFSEKYGGPKNAGKTLVFGGDIDYKKTGLTLQELNFLEGKIEVAREICTAFGVPHELIIPGQSTYNNKAEARLMLWEDTIIPLIDQLKGGLFKWMLESYGSDKVDMRPDLDKIDALVAKRERKARGTIDLWETGLIKRNEARTELGYEADDEADGYKNEGGQPAPPDPEDEDKSIERKNSNSWRFIDDEIDNPTIAGAISGLVKNEIDKLVRKYGDEIVGEIGVRARLEITDAVRGFIDEAGAAMITNVNRTTRRMIREEIEAAILNGEGVDALKARLQTVFKGTMSDVRIRRIAETEVTKITGFSGSEAIKQAGLEQREWLATLDAKTRDTHAGLNNEKVDKDGYFVASDGDRARYPGDFTRAGNNINCRCAVTAVFPGQKSLEPKEKRALWDKREKQRQPLDKSFMEVCRKMFNMQLEAVLTRVDEVTL